MNKLLKVFGVAVLTAVVALAMVACGGGDKPKTEAAAPAPVVEEVAEPATEEAATEEGAAENESEQPAETAEE